MAKTQIIIEYDDTVQESIDRFLDSQLKEIPIEGTNQWQPARIYPLLEDYVNDQFGQWLTHWVKLFPPAALQVKLDQIKVLQEEIEAVTRPTKLDDGGGKAIKP